MSSRGGHPSCRLHWATPHPTRAGALAQIDALETIIAHPGFRFNAAKRQCGQRVDHLGLLVDTVDMSLGFARSNSAVTRDTLIMYLRTLTEGQNISHALARRMAGKLGWHAQALQAGRLTSARGGSTSPSASTSGNRSAPSSSVPVWWIGVFNTWAVSERTPQHFPILSGAVFQADPSRLQIIVSDAAGNDGMGYYFGAVRRPGVPSRTVGRSLQFWLVPRQRALRPGPLPPTHPNIQLPLAVDNR